MTGTTLSPMPGIEHIAYERRQFIESIWDASDDDAPLLIYADWLDEHDDNGELVRWWVKARREHVPAIKPGRKEVDFQAIKSALQKLFDLRGQSACVLASVAVRWWQKKLHPIDWESLRKYHDDSDGLSGQIKSTWFAVELSGMSLLPIEVIDAARSSADAALSSAYAAWSSADAAGLSAYAARSSADAAGLSARQKLMRIGVATFSAKWWTEMPKPTRKDEQCSQVN